MSQGHDGADLGGQKKRKGRLCKGDRAKRTTEETKVMETREKVKVTKPEPRRCSICHGGPSEGLGEIVRFGGRLVPRTLRSGDNAWAHRLCIPTHLRRVSPLDASLGKRHEERRSP